MNRVQRWLLRLARVEPVDPGRADDGLVRLGTSGTELDPHWDALLRDLTDAREAWRMNPLARRLVSLVSSYVCGDGITLTSEQADLSGYLAAFWGDPQNRMRLRQVEWCEELSRSGELFVTLHMNPADGMCYVRALPASSIDRVICAPGDYETELVFHEAVGSDDPDYPEGRSWLGVDSAAAGVPSEAGRYSPVCLHFAVNRPVGCVRGESDLAAVLQWLRRYDGWLKDRVRLNAAVHAFLWIVRVPTKLLAERRAQLAVPPPPGSVMVVDQGDEEHWEAVAPDLHANDAAADGRAIRWMIAAGGPGIGLVDLGEAEGSNLATARAMADQRTRWMSTRQRYFGYVLGSVVLAAYNRAVRTGKVVGQERQLEDLQVWLPDINPGDNLDVSQSASYIANAFSLLATSGFGGNRWRRLVVRTLFRYLGESIDVDEIDEVLRESDAWVAARRGAAGAAGDGDGAD